MINFKCKECDRDLKVETKNFSHLNPPETEFVVETCTCWQKRIDPKLCSDCSRIAQNFIR